MQQVTRFGQSAPNSVIEPGINPLSFRRQLEKRSGSNSRSRLQKKLLFGFQQQGDQFGDAAKADVATHRGRYERGALTGHISSEYKQRAYNAGFDLFVTKPMGPETLKDVLTVIDSWGNDA